MRRFVAAAIEASVNKLVKGGPCGCNKWTVNLKFFGDAGFTAAQFLKDVFSKDVNNYLSQYGKYKVIGAYFRGELTMPTDGQISIELNLTAGGAPVTPFTLPQGYFFK